MVSSILVAITILEQQHMLYTQYFGRILTEGHNVNLYHQNKSNYLQYSSQVQKFKKMSV